MNPNSIFYQESRKISWVLYAFSYLIAISLVLIFSYIYSIVMNFIPNVFYIFITFGYGVLLGLIVQFLFKISQNRNKTSRFIQSIIVVIFAVYFQWTGHMVFLYNEYMPSFSLYLKHIDLFFYKEIYNDLYGMIKWGYGSILGMKLKGGYLIMFWFIEIAILFYGCVYFTINFKIKPFSELNKKWYKHFILTHRFKYIVSKDYFLKNILESNFIDTLKKIENSEPLRYSKVSIFISENEPNAYCSFETVYHSSNAGFKQISTKIKNYKLSNHQAQTILKLYDYKTANYFTLN